VFNIFGQRTGDIARSTAHVEDDARLVNDQRVEDGEGFWRIGGTQVIAIHHALVLKTPRVMRST
jgi:hypothetical protein